MTSFPADQPAPTYLDLLTSRMREGSRLLWMSALIMCGLAALCLGLQFVDPRMVGDANTWHKPAKFFLSIAVHFLTVSWALSLLAPAARNNRVTRSAIGLLVFSGWMEMVYIVFRAARGEASHFNLGTSFAQFAYTLMGIGAVTMTAVTLHVGWRLWRQRRDGMVTEAAAVGLMLAAVLGTVTAGYMSSQTGHAVGGMPGTGIGFFGWSTSGGDLRIAHFIGLHAAQFVPIAALSGRRVTVYAAAALITAATIAVFLQALAGMPLLRG